MTNAIIILYDRDTYFLSSPVRQSCLSDMYRKQKKHFQPDLFDDSAIARGNRQPPNNELETIK
jgi:hypothetical protein